MRLDRALPLFAITVIPRHMGRPPLSKDSKTTLTGVRLTDETRERIEALVGPKRMAAFIREAVEEALNRREAAREDCVQSPPPESD